MTKPKIHHVIIINKQLFVILIIYHDNIYNIKISHDEMFKHFKWPTKAAVALQIKILSPFRRLR